MTTNSTILNTYITPEGNPAVKQVNGQAIKLALRIQQLLNQSHGRIITLQMLQADGEAWLFVDNGKKEVIEP